MPKLFTLWLLLAAVSCSSANVGQSGCLPTGPLTPLSVPSEAELAPFLAKLEQEARAKWPELQNVPPGSDLVTSGVRERELFTWYLVYYPYLQGGAPSQPPAGFSLTAFAERMEDEHAGAAFMVEEWLGLPAAFRAENEGYMTYYFEQDTPQYSRAQLLWLINQVLEKFPTCFVLGGVWDSHEQGIGGAV